MSIDLRTTNIYPIIKNLTSIQTWTEVLIPSKANTITVGCESHDIYISFTGTDGGAVPGVDKAFIKANGYMELKRGRGTNQHDKLYVANKSSSSAEITIVLEE